MSALSRKKVLASFHAIDALAREANVPYQHAFDALNALVIAYEDAHAAEALRVRLRKYEGGATPMADHLCFTPRHYFACAEQPR